MKNQRITFRLEKEDDYRYVENLIRESFYNVYRPGCFEHYVMHVIRDRDDFVKELDILMELDGKVIGQNVFAKTYIKEDNGNLKEVLTMGPISIDPKYKRKGYGKILLDYCLEKAKELGYGAVFIEGLYDFYSKCGFEYVVNKYNIKYEDYPLEIYEKIFLVNELIPGYLSNIKGTYEGYQGYIVKDDEVDKFDATFPPKKKRKLPTQLF